VALAVFCDGRTDSELQLAVGPYDQPVPLETRFTAETTFAEVIDQVTRSSHRIASLQNFARAEDLEHATSHAPAAFMHANLDALPEAAPGLATLAPGVPVALALCAYTRGSELDAELWYDPACYSDADVQELADAYAALARSAVSDATQRVLALSHTDGERSWHSRSTYFVRGATADEPSEPAPPEPEPVVGDRPHAVWKVPADIGRRYAAVSGDVNPIHMNSLAAKAFGMPGTIAHGMWTKARVLGALSGRYGGASTVDAVFRSPLRTPSTALLYTAAVADGWDAALRSTKGKDHLLLTIRPT